MPRRAPLCTFALSGSAVLALVACGGDSTPDVPAECNPLGTTGCVLPWPSSVYQRADGSSPTGVRLDLPLGALPINVDGIEIDPAWINKRTGFSAMTQILVTFPGGVNDANLVSHADFPASLTDASPTVIVDMMTNQRVAHFAEIDVNEIDYPDNQVVYLRPAARLTGGHRYAVGVRKSLVGKAGGELAIPAGFHAVLDGKSSGHARLDAAAAGYPAVFQALETAGVPRTDLVVAFDFMVADEDSIIADQLAARDAVMAVVGDGESVAYQTTLDESPDSRDPMIARRVMFDYTTPEIADPLGTGFHRGGDGQVIAMGTTTAPASIIIPECATPTNKARIVIFGHGFFGSLEESMGGYIRRFAKDTCSVVIGGLWRGMSEDEVIDAIRALNDVNQLPGFTERMWQGMVDFMTLAKLAKGKLAREQLVDNPGNPGAQSIVDTSQIYYYGISQGHILAARCSRSTRRWSAA